jgi:4-carboxymuconolactone decarboxylase
LTRLLQLHPPRIASPQEETLPEDIRAAITEGEAATGDASNLFRWMAHNPGVLRKYGPFGGRLLLRSSLDPVDRELVILRTAWRCRCRYEWEHHSRIGRSVGLTDADIKDVARADPQGRTPREAALLRAADELVGQYAIDEPTWKQLAGHLAPAQLVELPLLIGNYVMLAGLINSLGVPVEDEASGE